MPEERRSKPVLTAERVAYYYGMGRTVNSMSQSIPGVVNEYPEDAEHPLDVKLFGEQFMEWYLAMARDYYEQGRMSVQVDKTFEEIYEEFKKKEGEQ